MTIQELGSLGEFVAAVATVATLAYLALQIRQSTQTARAEATQAAIEGSASWNAMLAADAELNEPFWRGMAAPESLGATDARRFLNTLNVFLRRESLCYYLKSTGNMPDVLWQARVRSLSGVLNQPGTHFFMQVVGDTLPDDFRAFLSELLSRDSTMTDAARQMLQSRDEL